MAKFQVIYYTTPTQNPISEFIDSLNSRQQVKVLRLLQTISLYGLPAVGKHVKKLSGTPLWEIRILGRDNIRIIYYVTIQTSIVLLHGFIKKNQKTSPNNLKIAIARYRQWQKMAPLAK